MDTQKELFFENPKLLGLARQIGPKNLGSLVHGHEHVVIFFTKFWILGLKHITPKYDIGRKEFVRLPSHIRGQ